MTDLPLPSPPSLTHGIPNLMTGIGQAFGAPAGATPPLPGLPAELSTARTVILLVVDGMGEAQVRRHLAGGILDRHCLQVIDSVFPTTTASAIGTFLTGVPPCAHALTGWHQWCEEIGETLAILPLRRPGATEAAAEAEDWATRILTTPPFADRLPSPVTHVVPHWIARTPFNRRMSGGVQLAPYKGTADLFRAVESAMAGSSGRQFIYAYWPEYDTVAHEVGADGDAAVAKLQEMEAAVAAFVARVRGSDALLLVTADHGFMTVPPERQLDLADHPDLAACLARPLTGERRAAYAHVLPGKGEEFAAGLRERLGHALWVAPSAELAAAGWFGQGTRHPRFASRIGDYTLILKDDWHLLDTRPGDRHHVMLGMHGGVSEAEMRVPLIGISL